MTSFPIGPCVPLTFARYTPTVDPAAAGDYKPTQLLAWLIRSSGYHGFVFPSAMGPGTNIVLFNSDDAEVTKINYVRVKRVAYFSEALSDYEDVSEEGPYDFVLSKV
jgi:hypothetical protein